MTNSTILPGLSRGEWGRGNISLHRSFICSRGYRTDSVPLLPGTLLGIFWGDDTRNRGILPEYATIDSQCPEGGRDGGAYLLRHRTYLVDADKNCTMGYANEGWLEANSFFQRSAGKYLYIMVVPKWTLSAHGVYEIFVNYWKEYWLERLSHIDLAGLLQYHRCYG